MQENKSSTTDAVDILWRQPMYGIPRKKSNTCGNAPMQNKSRLRYYNCNESSHFSMKCPKPRNMTNAVQTIMQKIRAGLLKLH